MKMNNKEIKKLIERFLDGDTTPAEECTIYSYFARHRYAGELERYRPMFEWYSSLASVRKTSRRKPVWFAAAGIAAAVALAIGLSFSFFRPSPTVDDDIYASYEGSYVIENGVRISDVGLLYDQLVMAESFADSISALDPEERILQEEAAVVDNTLNALLEGVDEEDLRNEIENGF